ncbi:Cysteine-rich RLK (receptor-like protein kinase) 8 [Cucumis melo var. makuwa]|uniref:Cysteine-rich RLK (Receptor-like protein kinase) 8 n=1 Tax=Cucumis melo var. makuwa TaxID=1194695 RepID=A0A5D3DQD3_CUCMM|nr:Cysteine-rich RLK (receptor-like protein kinase) 8 [Cucumis melo var. makuwa]
MPSCILYLQTPLDCLKESYPSTRLVSEVPLRVFVCIAYVYNFGPNQTKFTLRAQACVFVGVSSSLVRRNLRKEVRSSTSQPLALVHDFKPPLDQEKKNRGDETRVKIETHKNEVEQGHTGKLDECDPSFEIPIALRKGCKWVFSLKYKADGTLDRHKADVKNSCLNRDLMEEVYMSPPPGLEAQFGQQVCKLQKSLYGLKQSPRACFDRFTTFVKSKGYSQGHSDHTLFTNVSKIGKIVVLIVYVEDSVLTGGDQTEISQLKQRMGDEYEIKDLGNMIFPWNRGGQI